MSTNASMSTITRMLLALCAALLLTGCGEGDPGAIGPSGVDGSMSAEGQRQEYVDGVSRALDQLATGSPQNPGVARAIDTANRRQLQVASLAFRQGGQQLKGLNPPKDAVEGHTNLIKAIEALDAWNQRIVKAAPNKAATKKLAIQASRSPASQQYEAAVCQLVDAGFDVVDPGACTPLADASGPVG